MFFTKSHCTKSHCTKSHCFRNEVQRRRRAATRAVLPHLYSILLEPISGLCTYHAPTAATGYCSTGTLRRLQQPGNACTPRGTHTSLNAQLREDAGAPIGDDHFLGPKRVVSSPTFIPATPGKIPGGPGTGHTGDIRSSSTTLVSLFSTGFLLYNFYVSKRQ